MIEKNFYSKNKKEQTKKKEKKNNENLKSIKKPLNITSSFV